MNKGLGDTIQNMKTLVKLIIFIFLVQMLLSCESSSEVEALCECDKYTQVRYITIQNGTVTSDTGFQDNGSNEYYGNDCKDDNAMLGGYETTQVNGSNQLITKVRYKVKCN